MSTTIINPLATGYDAWDRITIAGVDFKGKVEVSGTGFKNKLDHRSARGTDGGRATASGKDAVKFKVMLGCFEDSHFAQLDAVIERLTGRSPERRDRHAFEIFHPALAQLGITLALVEEISLMEPTGPGGLFTQEINFREFHPPPPRQQRNPTTRTPTTPQQGAQTRPSITPIRPGVSKLTPTPAPRPAQTARPSRSGATNP